MDDFREGHDFNLRLVENRCCTVIRAVSLSVYLKCRDWKNKGFNSNISYNNNNNN